MEKKSEMDAAPEAGKVRPFSGDKRKLIVILSLLLGAGFVVIALVNYYVSRAAIRESIVANELPLTSDTIYSELQKDLIRPVFISSMMASDTFLRDWVISGEKDVGHMTKYLHEVMERYHTFTGFFVSDRTATYYHADGVLKRVRPDEPRDKWYYRVRDMNTPYEINLDPDLANKDALTIFINYRVLDYDGRFIGAAGVGLTVDAVHQLLDKYQQRYARTIYFVDPQGKVVMTGDGSGLRGADIRTLPGIGALADRILQKEGGSFQYKSGGSNHLLNVRYIPELDWYLLAEKNEDAMLAGIRHTLYSNLALAFIVTAVVLLLTSVTISRYQGRLETMATTDKLTGLANRQAFEILIGQMLREAERSKLPLTAILVDIDHFKQYNDNYGHLAGDKVIRHVAAVVRSMLRQSDIVCRWGGEEFLVVIKDCGRDEGMQIAGKICNAVRNEPFRLDGATLNITISAGVACGFEEERLLVEADAALYAAKEAGRDQVKAV
ncbi:MAG TPA: sensor domain-containing diguanylate cyclase [Sideroxyarcus sp.]|nr:sensor domain-containing diguanylate cyclase [Sideroxyarcus sp.]